MENFTPLSAFFGGVLIGLSVVLLLLTDGRIAGIRGSPGDCSGIEFGILDGGWSSSSA